MNKPRRATPRKHTHPEPARARISNRARRREALEQSERAARRRCYPDPEPGGEYRP